MLFNSISFLIFLPTVFVIYWFLSKGKLKWQNIFILFASYTFYGWWDYRFLALIAASTFIDYIISIQIEKQKNIIKRKSFLIISLVFNLGILGVFKYYDFFINSWQNAWNSLGFDMNISSLNIILPVGISFYTFQTLSYTIDVYRKKMRATRNFIEFAGFVSFFPQLVAGPIERASHLLPQFSQKKIFNEEFAKSGLNLIIWGLFKKIVIADTCAIYVNTIFENFDRMNSLSLTLGAIYFSFQIYADFSGYSDIAIGTARLFGFDLMRNFNYPYFSQNIGEFWKRWHISLSTWFRDYVYIPLGGSLGTKRRTTINIFIIFVVSGLWHGANWTFIIWGILNAIFYLPIIYLKKAKNYSIQIASNKILPTAKELIKVLSTFSLITFAWIFFRASSLTNASNYISRIFKNGDFAIQFLPIERNNIEPLIIIAIFVLIEWFNRRQQHPFNGKFKTLKLLLVIFMLLTLGVYSDYQKFIYFQF